MTQELIIFLIFTFLINLPAGLWRSRVRKRTFQWFCSVHLPVPFLILMRYILDLELTWMLLAMEVPVYALGQFLGGKILKKKPAKLAEA